MVLSSCRHKEKKVGLDVSREDLLGSVLAKVDHQGQRVTSNEGRHTLFSHLALQIVPALIKVLEDDNASSLVLSKHRCLGGDTKGEIVHATGSRQEGLSS